MLHPTPVKCPQSAQICPFVLPIRDCTATCPSWD